MEVRMTARKACVSPSAENCTTLLGGSAVASTVTLNVDAFTVSARAVVPNVAV